MFTDEELELIEEALVSYDATTWGHTNAEQRVFNSILEKIDRLLNGQD